MSEVSNKTLATLLVVAIVVSLGGTFVSLQRLSQYATGPVALTGAFDAYGRVNVTITEDITIYAVDNLIWFGEGSVATTNDYYAELWSNGTKDADWQNSTAYLPDPTYAGTNEDFIIIENQGNIKVNLTVLTSQNASEYLCTAPYDCPGLPDAQYEYWTTNNASGSCFGSLQGNSSSRTDFIGDGSTKQNVCDSLKSDPTNDTIRLYVYLKIPQNAQGSKNDTLTFTSTASLNQ
jgi:hypothetical protein